MGWFGMEDGRTYMTYKEFGEQIREFDYVVQRNWDGLPNEPGCDIDIFASTNHAALIQALAQSLPIKVDVRFPGDGYYPHTIEHELLADHRLHKGWKIPTKQAAYDALMYHSLIHKENHPYEQKLVTMFLQIHPPTEPDDKGVGFYADRRLQGTI